MAGLSDFSENAFLDHVWGNTAWSIGATFYAALFTSAPTDAGGGTEVTGGSYARVAITRNTTNFPTTATRVISNGAAITFPTATANWGTCVSLGIFDASTSGNLICWQNLTTSKVVNNGNTFSFGVGQLDVTWVTGGLSTTTAAAALNFIFNAAALSAPATFYLTLYQTSPTDSDTGTEEAGVNYARAAVTNNTTNFPNAASGVKATGTTINFATPGAGGWGPITHFGWRDALAAGTLWAYGALTASTSPASGDGVSVSAGGATITQD